MLLAMVRLDLNSKRGNEHLMCPEPTKTALCVCVCTRVCIGSTYLWIGAGEGGMVKP